MRNRNLFVTCLLLALAWPMHAAQMQFVLKDSVGNPATNVEFVVTDLSAPLASGGATVSKKPIVTNSYNGTIIISNLVAATYRCDLNEPEVQTSWRITVPNTNGLVDASTVITTSTGVTPGGQAFSMSASDLRYTRPLWQCSTQITIANFGGSAISIFSTNGTGSMNMVAGFFAAHARLRVKGHGNLTATAGQTLHLNTKVGSASADLGQAMPSLDGTPFFFEVTFACRKPGTSGTIRVGLALIGSNSPQFGPNLMLFNEAALLNVDTTVPQTVDITALTGGVADGLVFDDLYVESVP